ncbi:MAG: hypothetical protein IKU26_02050 [Clostridia bacterium]|nr:hypothetical protein [Clostridia bacterium]
MKNRLEKFAYNGIAVSWSVLAGLILLIVIGFSGSVSYNGKRVFALPYWAILLLGVLVMAVGILLYIRYRQKIDHFAERLPWYTIWIFTAGLFLLQLIIFYNIYFETGWDSGYIVSIARRIAAGEEGFTAWYFGRYPNNFLLVWFYSVVFRGMSWLGLGAWDGFAVVAFQCMLSCLCGYLLYQVVRELTNVQVALFAWFVYAVHIGLSPWLMILYSDGLVLCFPVVLVRLYQLAQNGKFVWVKWAGIGCLSYLGYKTKPQIAIVFIAIVLVELVRFCFNIHKKEVVSFIQKGIACGVSGLLVMLLFTQLILPSLPFIYSEKSEFGMEHYFMMGLNPDTQGGYSDADVDFSNSYYTVERRKEANKRMIRARLEMLGVEGVSRQYARKVLINYGDGAYAWSGEGTFYNTMFEDRNETLSPFLKDIYYRNGQYHTLFLHLQQWIWLILLVGSVGSGLYFLKRKKFTPTLVVPLTLIGITIFLTLFEARARYLFAFGPFFIIVGISGWVSIARIIKRLIAPRCQSS